MSAIDRTGRALARLTLALALVAVAPATAVEAPPTGPAPDPAGMLGTTRGEDIYRQICQGCHMPDGRGAEGGGSYPAFAGNPRLASPQYLAVTILAGRRNMPSFARPEVQSSFFPPTWLTDEQVASVINYVRTSFGNDYPADVTADDVRAVRPKPGD